MSDAQARTAGAVFRYVCKGWGVGLDALLSTRRTAPLVEARFAAVGILRHVFLFSFSEIGRSLGRHHATIMSAEERVSERYRASYGYRYQLRTAAERALEQLGEDESKAEALVRLMGADRQLVPKYRTARGALCLRDDEWALVAEAVERSGVPLAVFVRTAVLDAARGDA